MIATKELAKAALETMDKGYAGFLCNHGFLAAFTDIEMAFTIAEEIEHCSEIYLRAFIRRLSIVNYLLSSSDNKYPNKSRISS